MPRPDLELRSQDVLALSSRQGVASFFLSLGYDVQSLPQSADALGITDESLRRHIQYVEQLAVQEDDFGTLYVYLFEMRSMRVADRQALARSFRNKPGDYLFVITSDYESLDFVLLERQTPESQGTAFARKQVAVRPHVLTVERRNPSPVALRVLRRFTYTEPDVLYQVDKLLSAYVVAAWSEAYFNNRALFSDYYLTARLPETDAWQESPDATYRALQDLFAAARERIAHEKAGETRTELVEPALRALGWAWRAGGATGDSQPDYTLTQPGGEEPLALCLAYPWNRHLDTPDPADPDRPDDIPGQRVVSVLAGGEAPYAILTNGKLWRLYAAQAHSRATNYYEIDLEETLNSPERATAIRYFWLFFRAAAFVPQAAEDRSLSFLDQVLEGSENYARELGERLKDRVFDDIFPHFAEGFIEHIRHTEGKDAALDQPRLDLIYQGTLTFLYRLMFLLYAEARDLLPVREARGYAEISLGRLKAEVAQKGGDIEDEAPGKLREAYSPSSTGLYERLSELFAVVDRGDPDRNVPRYNGGLFDTQPREDDASPEAAAARFLAGAAIPDRYLALGLDRLARDVDPKRRSLAMIDFKSLGVRQLGSIYEGLLEFKLRVAPEKMAVVKGKRTEEVIPFREVKRQKVRETLAKGAPYLENTRQERKATGSYYTPDYIVKYIVEHTVGPVLAEKFEALTPGIRNAQGAFIQHRRNTAVKSQQHGGVEDPEKFWNSAEMQRLAYDVLDVKVLDPAMGSGHFLVEAVDFITDRLLNFLNGFPHNPVRASLSQTRQAILTAMDEQGVSVDAKRLTDVNLLKRQVLKRCVYGVDLNPMAVELAKVSLWLDAFTLGAPLSFLDHHLRCGNSLIGTTAREAERNMVGESSGQLSLFQGPFVGLLQSAEIMRGIGMLADATIEQAQESVELFRNFENAATSYKQLLDLYTLQQFKVDRAAEFLETFGEKARENLQEPESLAVPYRRLLAKREAMAEQYRFFHWDLEFPEVFIDLDHAQWSAKPGFDAVIGNPPWISITGRFRSIEVTDAEVNYLTQKYQGNTYMPNMYEYFVSRGLLLVRDDGYFSFIVPDRLGFNSQFVELRHKILMETAVESLVYKVPFHGVTADTMIFAVRKGQIAPGHRIAISEYSKQILMRPQSRIRMHKEFVFEYFESAEIMHLIDKIDDLPIVSAIAAICDTTSGFGGKSSLIESHRSSPTQIRTLKGDSIGRYEHRKSYWFEFRPENITGRTTDEDKLGAVPKILLRKTGDRIIATYDSSGAYPEQSLYFLYSNKSSLDFRYILGVLNSSLLTFYYRIKALTNKESIAQVKKRDLDQLPIVVMDFEQEGQLNQYRQLISLVDDMLNLNSRKRDEMNRLLSWLESTLETSIDDLSGRTIFRNYLGDYREDEAPLTEDELIYRLYSNKSKFSVNFTDTLQRRIRQEYQASLDVLLPVKRRLADTDWLIDQIVYRLYGLTDEEIAIVEGRG